jgi:hypothetical protein
MSLMLSESYHGAGAVRTDLARQRAATYISRLASDMAMRCQSRMPQAR